MSGSHGVSPRDRAVWSLRSEIRAAARDVYGAAVVETPIEGMQVMTRSGLDEPLAGVRAAVLARDVALRALREYAEAARGVGRTWDDIAAAVGLAPTAGEGEPRDAQAYRLLIEGRPLPAPAERPLRSHRRAARWTCGACGRRVTDAGPFEGAPLHTEAGHAGDCVRHAGEIAAYRATWGEQ